jgi:hypothetical protein
VSNKDHIPFGANAVRLNGRDWLVVIAVVLAVCWVTPRAWRAVEPLDTTPDYRLPYASSNDYWLYERWAEQATEGYTHFLLGDSVIWGPYVKKDETLSHYLNAATGEDRFANLGLDGLHPAAMAGLAEHYCGPIRNRPVLVNLNPLWMSSPRSDLQDRKWTNFNHPKLVPQITPDLPCYDPSFAKIAGITGERYLTFFSWLNHIKASRFDNLSLKEWTIENPYSLPPLVSRSAPAQADNKPKFEPVSWDKNGAGERDFPWVLPEDSLQWRMFRQAVATLQSRGNRVFVLVGPFNPYMMTEESKARYCQVRDACEAWLTEENIPHYRAPDLPSELYADASHPLAEGYEQLAEALLHNGSFSAWMGAKPEQAGAP